MTTSQMDLLTDLSLKTMTTPLKKAVQALQAGNVILLLDAHERENEGDLIVAAEKITPSTMNFLIKEGSGVVCLAMPKSRLDELGLPLMASDNTNFFQTAFTVSIEARRGVTTGVSAKDRAHTILTAMADNASAADLARPGHVFPLAARKGGVFERMGHTEGSVDLMRIASLKPGAVLCELMNADGSMTIGNDRIAFAKKHDLPVISVEDVLLHRIKTEAIFEKTTKSITTRFDTLTWHSFRFFDSIVVDIFHKPSFAASADKPARVSLASGENLRNRFFMQALDPKDDDPFVAAIKDLHSDRSNCAVMTTIQAPSTTALSSEVAFKINAVICRALTELSIHDVVCATDDVAFSAVAAHFFPSNR